jgi:hypothetical protein
MSSRGHQQHVASAERPEDHPVTLATLRDKFHFDTVSATPGLARGLQATPQGRELWGRLTRANLAVSLAAGPTLGHVVRLLKERWGSYGPASLDDLANLLVTERGLTAEQAEALPLVALLDHLREVRRKDPEGASLRRVGEVWHLRYQGESADFPVRGNQFLGWLAKLLAKPNHALTVAELRGDSEGKLKADARLGGEYAKDMKGLREINDRIRQIDEITELAGSSDHLEAEREKLLREVAAYSAKGRIGSSVGNAYNNITTQKRLFLTKLEKEMPQLAAHLRSCITQFKENYALSYRPPAGTPRWHIENPSGTSKKNPSA